MSLAQRTGSMPMNMRKSSYVDETASEVFILDSALASALIKLEDIDTNAG